MADNAARVGGLLTEIRHASSEQAEGIEQVNRVVSGMDKVTQQNAATAEESAGASEEMSAQAVQMKSVVDDLIAMVHGGEKDRSKTAGSVMEQPDLEPGPAATPKVVEPDIPAIAHVEAVEKS